MGGGKKFRDSSAVFPSNVGRGNQLGWEGGRRRRRNYKIGRRCSRRCSRRCIAGGGGEKNVAGEGTEELTRTWVRFLTSGIGCMSLFVCSVLLCIFRCDSIS